MSARLLYVCARPQRDAAEAEYASFLAGMGVGPEALDRHDLVREALPADAVERYSGFVVGGSPFNVTDPTSLKSDAQLRLETDLETIATAAAGARTSALFTCFGIGVVTRLLGGNVTRDNPEETGPATVELTPDAGTDPLFGALPSHFEVLTAHKEGAGAAPHGAVLLATNAECPVQAYRVGDHLYATQFHPEPTPRDFTQRMAVYRDGGYFDASDYELIASRVLEASITEPPRLLEAFAQRAAA